MNDRPVAIVTGAGRGIGRALALALAQDGYRTVLMARTREQLESVAGDIAQLGGAVPEPAVYALDIADQQAVREAAQSIVERFGRVDVLVNNAGRWAAGIFDISPEEFRQLLAVNVAGALTLVQTVAPVMKRQGRGHIFNIASRAGKVGFPEEGAYCASKFALVGLSEALCKELAPQGIKVTSLCPAWVDTDMARQAGTPLPSAEMIQPDDLVKTVRWLLSLSPAACVREVLIECRHSLAS
ncbi:MAG: SDR family oxidoreductase [Sedimentisphaerales bacterium]|nr:SDR family oxidoreductase [Sedimentisphaerales bacterium]